MQDDRYVRQQSARLGVPKQQFKRDFDVVDQPRFGLDQTGNVIAVGDSYCDRFLADVFTGSSIKEFLIDELLVIRRQHPGP